MCLSPFSLDDFVKAIVHAGDDSLILIEEIFYSLLNALAPKKALTLQNWEPHLRRYLIHSSKEAQSKLKAKEKDEDPGSDVDDTEENLNENGKGSSDGNGDAKMEDADEDEEIDEGGNVSALAGEREKLAYAIRTTTWNRMEASDKIAILQFLCDDILDPEITETVRFIFYCSLWEITVLKSDSMSHPSDFLLQGLPRQCSRETVKLAKRTMGYDKRYAPKCQED